MFQQLRVMKLYMCKLSQATEKQELFQQILIRRKKPVKRKIFMFLLVNIYYYLIKYLAKKTIYYHMSSQAMI